MLARQSRFESSRPLVAPAQHLSHPQSGGLGRRSLPAVPVRRRVSKSPELLGETVHEVARPRQRSGRQRGRFQPRSSPRVSMTSSRPTVLRPQPCLRSILRSRSSWAGPSSVARWWGWSWAGPSSTGVFFFFFFPRCLGWGWSSRAAPRRVCSSGLTATQWSYWVWLPVGLSTPNHHMRSASPQPPRRGRWQARSDAWMTTARADKSMTADDVQRHDPDRFLAPSFNGRIASSRTSGTAFSRKIRQGRATR